MIRTRLARLAVLLLSALWLAGCGGGGGDGGVRQDLEAQVETLTGERDTARDEVTMLEADLKTATDKVTMLEADLKTATDKVTMLEGTIGTVADSDSLRGMLAAEKAKVTRLTTELSTAETVAETYKRALDNIRGDLATARDDVEKERQRADDVQQQANQRVQTLEANQQATSLLRALEDLEDSYNAMAPPSFSTTSPVTIPTPARNSLTITKNLYTGRAFSAPSFIGRRLTRTHLGKETIVVLTDREVNRKILDHHFAHREGANDEARRTASRFDIGTGGANFALADVRSSTTSQVKLRSRVFPVAQTAPDQVSKMAPTYRGSVYGKSGTFECGGVENCKVQLDPTYRDADNDDETAETLTAVAISATASGVLYFRPGSATISLDASLGPVFVDDEYMLFGWWRTEPSTPGGDYTYEVFANANHAAAPGGMLGATYSGTAVGVYVEQSGTAADLSKRQGEFTAAVNLTASSDTMIKGQIGSFKTTPAGGSSQSATSQSWLVVLDDAVSGTITTAVIKNVPGSASSEGGWQYTLVGNHTNVDPAANPSGAVGVFDTRIPDLLHISGAFGAKRQ